MSQTVLVTGGTGFVAKWCMVELLKRGFFVRTTLRTLDRAADVRTAISMAGVNTDRLSFFKADLMADEGWDNAVAGCDYVLHVASPLGIARKDRNAFVAPAVEGTRRVLRAAIAAGVKRVVMTSAAATARPPLDSGRTSDETIWADPDDPQFDAYRLSKILAERAAWDFMAKQSGATEFVTVLPGAVFGPVLSGDNLGSVKIIKDLIEGRPRLMPRLGFWVVDVRDLAEIHVRAMLARAAAGQRFIAAGEFMWMEDIAIALRNRLGPAGRKVPSLRLPDFMVRLLLPFMPQLATLAPLIGRKFMLTSQKARFVLDFSPRPGAETAADCAASLIENGWIEPRP